MPVYEYACDKCGHTTEAVRSISDRARGPRCQRCRARMRKEVSLPQQHIPDRYGFATMSEENGGRGRWMPMLGEMSDPNAYARSQEDGFNKALAKGLNPQWRKTRRRKSPGKGKCP